MNARTRLEYERTAHRWTEAERRAASDRIAAHFAAMADRRRANRRGVKVLAALLLLLPIAALVAA